MGIILTLSVSVLLFVVSGINRISWMSFSFYTSFIIYLLFIIKKIKIKIYDSAD